MMKKTTRAYYLALYVLLTLRLLFCAFFWSLPAIISRYSEVYLLGIYGLLGIGLILETNKLLRARLRHRHAASVLLMTLLVISLIWTQGHFISGHVYYLFHSGRLNDLTAMVTSDTSITRFTVISEGNGAINDCLFSDGTVQFWPFMDRPDTSTFEELVAEQDFDSAAVYRIHSLMLDCNIHVIEVELTYQILDHGSSGMANQAVGLYYFPTGCPVEFQSKSGWAELAARDEGALHRINQNWYHYWRIISP